MELNSENQHTIRQYLLGKLTEDEQELLEQRLMVEDDLFEELQITKGEVVEEYCENTLARDECEWLEGHFLASKEGRERQALTLSLNKLARVKPGPPPTFFARLIAALTTPQWIAATGVAVVLIVAALVLIPARGQVVDAGTLANNITNREQGVLPRKITVPPKTKALQFRLELPRNAGPNTNYRAQLDNKTDLNSVDVVARDSNSVTVVIPLNLIPRGEYSLKLILINADKSERELPGDYRFNIE